MSDIAHYAAPSIGIVCPLGIELRVCRNVLELSDIRHVGKRKIFSGNRYGYSINAVKGGLGGIKSSVSTRHFIESVGANLIIAAGTAGALTANGRIGDVIVVRRAIPYRLEQSPDTAPITDEVPERTTVDSLEETDLKRLSDFVDKVGSTLKTTVRIADTASGMVTVRDQRMRNRLHETTGAEICDWETAGILKTARQSGIPCLAFRVITDRADRRTLWDFARNYRRSLDRLFEFMKEFMGNDGIACIGV